MQSGVVVAPLVAAATAAGDTAAVVVTFGSEVPSVGGITFAASALKKKRNEG